LSILTFFNQLIVYLAYYDKEPQLNSVSKTVILSTLINSYLATHVV